MERAKNLLKDMERALSLVPGDSFPLELGYFLLSPATAEKEHTTSDLFSSRLPGALRADLRASLFSPAA
jgi:hypothetical protein